ncbi:MAG: hypothetical protein K6C10_00400 [Prevotella sp.]|nr:hypothetical protein [Prevotella sp.]
MNEQIEHSPWCENVIIADADYADRVAFDLIVNFERMLERRIPQADLSTWIVCMALDGGVKGETNTQVVLLHSKTKSRLDNFQPSDFDTELNGQAFRDEQLGEFQIAAVPVEADMVSHEDLFLDVVGTVLSQPEVKRVIIVPNAEEGTLYDDLRETLRRHDQQEAESEKQITILTMEPRAGGRFQQDLLGYSLMAALGIRGDEFRNE